jgi:hypothetical protein
LYKLDSKAALSTVKRCFYFFNIAPFCIKRRNLKGPWRSEGKNKPPRSILLCVVLQNVVVKIFSFSLQAKKCHQRPLAKTGSEHPDKI